MTTGCGLFLTITRCAKELEKHLGDIERELNESEYPVQIKEAIKNYLKNHLNETLALAALISGINEKRH